MSFECGAGVCLWADDAEARAKWCAAVSFDGVALPVELAAEGAALMAEFDAACDAACEAADRAAGPRWGDAAAAEFHGRAAMWTERVMDALATCGIEVAPYGAEPGDATDSEAALAGEEFEGCVVAVFGDVAARAAVDRKELAGTGWDDAAVWNGDALKLRAAERTPAELLAKLEREPGFVCGWWQRREDRGEEAMLAGDPVVHAVECVRTRNVTGLANFLSWLRVERVHLGDELAALEWSPTKGHRIADAGGSWWEWFSFARNASKALRGEAPSAGYLRAERERLFWRWTHGGSRDGWPANCGEALERGGWRRESFTRWAK
ncbi:MAG: hypothetical protein KF715_09315 [Candidatus Didemnitutus sp.]|nr:hypothetical protein [Candidatus Didemnitutus sp.]